jgi:hypothetical protein
MTGRLDRARRLLAVQRQLHDLSKLRLAVHLSHSVSLDERYRNLMRFLQNESAFSGLFSATVLRRLHTLEEMRAQANIKEDELRTSHIQDRRCLRHAERLADTLQSDEDRTAAARELEDAAGSRRPRQPQGSRKLPEPPF